MNRQPLGFVIPLQTEADPLLTMLDNKKEVSYYSRRIILGNLNNQDCAVIISGCGKIKSASAAQLLIDKYPSRLYIHYGTAGGLSPNLKIGDVVAATSIVEHDVTELFPKPIPPPIHKIDNRLLKKIQSKNLDINYGTILSGDEDIVTTKKRDVLFKNYKALSVDWESAGFAHTCNLNRKSCCVFRAISDYAYEKTAEEYEANSAQVIKNLVAIVVNILPLF